MGIQNAISSGSIPTYSTISAFPALAKDGQVAVALDTDALYVFDGTSSTWVTSSSTPDNFSYKVIASATSVTIPINQQMIVIDSITVDGTLITNGELYLLAV